MMTTRLSNSACAAGSIIFSFQSCPRKRDYPAKTAKVLTNDPHHLPREHSHFVPAGTRRVMPRRYSHPHSRLLTHFATAHLHESSMFDSEGVVAISRGPSAATPPVTWSNMVLDPESGSQHAHPILAVPQLVGTRRRTCDEVAHEVARSCDFQNPHISREFTEDAEVARHFALIEAGASFGL